MARRTGFPSPTLRVAMAALCVLSLAACSDGYPTKDVLQIEPAPKTGGEMQAVTVLESPRWSDTVRARPLLTHLEVRCGNPAVPAV